MRTIIDEDKPVFRAVKDLPQEIGGTGMEFDEDEFEGYILKKYRKKSVNYTLRPSEIKLLSKISRENGISRSEMVGRLIRQYKKRCNTCK